MPEDNTLLAKICTRTTCHGPLDYYQSKGLGRLFWALITLGAFAAIGYYTYQVFVQYLRMQTATSITAIDRDKLDFPNVTICNPSRYNATYITERMNQIMFMPDESMEFKREYVRYLRLLSFSADAYNETSDYQLVYNLQTVYEQMFNTTVDPRAVDVQEFIRRSTFECDQYLIGCKFSKEPFDCCKNARMPFTDNGYCYTIDVHANTSTNGYQTGKGEEFGLDINIQLNTSDIVLMSPMEEIGIRVHVVDYATPMDFNPIGVPPSMHAHIRLNPIHYILTKDGRGDQCLDQGKRLDPYETYTKTLCEMKCLDDMIWESCKCAVMASFVKRDRNSVCTPVQMLQCIYPRIMGISADSAVYMDKLLQCYSTQCPKMCDYWSYSTYVMYSEIGGQHLESDHNQTMNIKLSVYFADLIYEEYEEQLLTDTNTFVSNLGGVVGLWSGVSILTLVQCLVIFICGPCEEKPHAQ